MAEVRKIYSGGEIAVVVLETDDGHGYSEIDFVAKCIALALPYAGWTSEERERLSDLKREMTAPPPV